MSVQSESSSQPTATADAPTITFRVTGMTCAGCAAGLQKTLAADAQIEIATVSIVSGLARVRTRLSAAEVIERIQQRGFDAALQLNSQPASA
ncbi:MAG: heavy-metal-associated domain-containing protein, partial [Planctomycetaceae bacterium]